MDFCERRVLSKSLRGEVSAVATLHTYNTHPEPRVPCSEILINNNGYGTMAQAGIDPPAQSHASYEASALHPSHHGWIPKISNNVQFKLAETNQKNL